MDTFARDIDKGFSAAEKFTSSMYFYDDDGSRIFQEIMDMPEYYLTNSEFEILQFQSEAIYKALEFEGHFNVIELGAGDGLKTFHLLRYLLSEKIDFTYIPVDISGEAMNILQDKLLGQLPDLKIQPMVGDYFKILAGEIQSKSSPNLMLFLGSNLGNYCERSAFHLLELFYQNMKTDDKLLIGIDLQKNPVTINNAYFDPHGITKAFNINLLKRINRELGGDIDIEKFDFYCHYNPLNGEVRSYLVSLSDQDVYLSALGKTYHFSENELISTELSKKYTLSELEGLAGKMGFRVQEHFLDEKHYFADSLWVK